MMLKEGGDHGIVIFSPRSLDQLIFMSLDGAPVSALCARGCRLYAATVGRITPLIVSLDLTVERSSTSAPGSPANSRTKGSGEEGPADPEWLLVNALDGRPLHGGSFYDASMGWDDEESSVLRSKSSKRRSFSFFRKKGANGESPPPYGSPTGDDLEPPQPTFTVRLNVVARRGLAQSGTLMSLATEAGGRLWSTDGTAPKAWRDTASGLQPIGTVKSGTETIPSATHLMTHGGMLYVDSAVGLLMCNSASGPPFEVLQVLHASRDTVRSTAALCVDASHIWIAFGEPNKSVGVFELNLDALNTVLSHPEPVTDEAGGSPGSTSSQVASKLI